MSGRLFCYGTLLPGQPRWCVLRQLVAPGTPQAATARGQLYRTPYGWPAAVFADDADGCIPGFVFGLRDPAAALERLDAVEGVAGGLFARRSVETTAGRCWTYHWPGPVAGFQLIARWLPVPA